MKLLCKYHPTRLAHFHCPDCGDHYCPDCIEVKKKGLGTIAARRCIRCGAEVEWVGVGNLIEPLTTRVPKIFLYGFAPWPLTLNILLILGNFIFSLPSLYFFLIRLALFALLVKYAFAALRATARGILTPPPAWGDSVTTDFSTVFKQFMIFVVVGAVTGYVSTQVGKGAGILFALASLAYLPAMVIMLAATDSLLAALNPIGFCPLAFRIGKDYLLMYFFLTILLGAPAALWSAFLQHLPTGVSLLLAQFAGNYYMIIAYHLMGYVILLHHQDIGYEVRYDEFRGAEKQNGQEEKSPQQQLLSQASVMIKEGAADEALELIKMKIRYEQLTDVGLAECYFDLVQMKKKTDLLKDRGAEFYRLFFDAKRRQKAAEAYAALSALDPSFSLDAGELFKVAGWLVESGRYREGLNAYSRFIKENPDHDLKVQAYFTSARLLNERLGKPQKAQEVLRWIEKKYPLHELMPHVRTYAAKISSAGPPAAPKAP